MKKILVVIIAFFLLSACGGGSSNKDSKNKENDIPQWDPKKGPVDIEDRKIYFAVIDGKKYDLNTKITTFFDDGYSTYSDENMKSIVKAGKYVINDVYFRKNDQTYFCMQPINRTSKDITKEECTVFSISIHDTWYTNATIIGDLTIGSSREEVEAVFGTTYEIGSSEEYRNLVFGKIMKYGFKFSFDETWHVKTIMVYSYEN